MLGNGMCNRPAELDCRIESACESCAYFRTGPEFVPVLLRQLNHAREHGQTDRSSSTRGWSTERPRSRLDTDYMYNAGDGRVIDGHVLAIRELPPTGTTGAPRRYSENGRSRRNSFRQRDCGSTRGRPQSGRRHRRRRSWPRSTGAPSNDLTEGASRSCEGGLLLVAFSGSHTGCSVPLSTSVPTGLRDCTRINAFYFAGWGLMGVALIVTALASEH